MLVPPARLDHRSGGGDLACHQHRCLGRLQDEQHSWRTGCVCDEDFGGCHVFVELVDELDGRVLALEDGAQGR